MHKYILKLDLQRTSKKIRALMKMLKTVIKLIKEMTLIILA